MITSTSNSRIKNVIRLNTSSKARREQNAFVAEGIKMFMEAPSCDVSEVFVSEEYFDKLQNSSPKKDGSCDKDDAYDARNNEILNKLAETGFVTYIF